MNEKAERILFAVNVAIDNFYLIVKKNPENIKLAKEKLKTDVERIFEEAIEGNQKEP
jgi:hypothetical protein